MPAVEEVETPATTIDASDLTRPRIHLLLNLHYVDVTIAISTVDASVSIDVYPTSADDTGSSIVATLVASTVGAIRIEPDSVVDHF